MNRFSNVEVYSRLLEDQWKSIEMGRRYKVVTSSYLAVGGDTFTAAHDASILSFNNNCARNTELLDTPLEEYELGSARSQRQLKMLHRDTPNTPLADVRAG
jgi:hypothetical protein